MMMMIHRIYHRRTIQYIHLHVQQRRTKSSPSSLYIAGHGWPGTFGTGPQTITSPETSYVSDEERENDFKSIQITNHDDSSHNSKIVNAAAGWGHTVVLHQNESNDDDIQMYVAGRPYDFQPLLRLHRLPSFIRRTALSLSLMLDEETGWGGSSGSSDDRNSSSNNSSNSSNSENEEKEEDPLATFRKSVYPHFQEIKLPNNDVPIINTKIHTNSDTILPHRTLAASAGFTAVIGKSGKAYTFGLNRSGQCGVGNRDDIHIWEPTQIKLPSIDNTNNNNNAVTDIALGLQHGILLDESGKIYTWGKASRGQLGLSEDERSVQSDLNSMEDIDSKSDFEYSPLHIDLSYHTNDAGANLFSDDDLIVERIAAGWNHSAVLTKSNDVWIWGKNVLIDEEEGNAADAVTPVQIKGLPNDKLRILDISCGSHHTSILMEDGSVYARGISTDTKEPIGGDTVVQIIPPGLIDMPIQQFVSHFDRTTVVAGKSGDSGGGSQVLEVQLWSTDGLRKEAVFEPAWVEKLLDYGEDIDDDIGDIGDDSCTGIESVHRGWHHTIVLGCR